MLNEALNVVAALDYEQVGEVVMFKELLADGDRALVIASADEERVVRLAEPLRDGHDPGRRLAAARHAGRLRLREGAEVRGRGARPRRGPGHRLRRRSAASRGQIEAIQDAVELPYLHPELFKEHQLRPPKGVLLYGPPGCGKTLIAKAVANSLAKKVAARTGQEGKSYFLNIKGPELLNKYVGETERHIRLVFQRAREKASEGTPVIVFFDEMDSLFRTRGSGVSSDVENTIVPQLLSEIDGVELLENVLVIGASNREDMIDPAILRPGRLDVKIKIERPDAESARDIFSQVPHRRRCRCTPTTSPSSAATATRASAAMIQATVERMYTETEENRFLEVTYANGDKEVLYFKDFNSGAMIQNIVDRAKKMAIKDFLDHQQHGLRVSHLLAGVRGRVQGERGPAQHHQPRRLGAHLRQEGRADRLHPHAHHRQAGHRAGPLDRHGPQHRSVPVAAVGNFLTPAVSPELSWSRRSVWRLYRLSGARTHRHSPRHAPARRARAARRLCSRSVDRATASGLRGRRAPSRGRWTSGRVEDRLASRRPRRVRPRPTRGGG